MTKKENKKRELKEKKNCITKSKQPKRKAKYAYPKDFFLY